MVVFHPPLTMGVVAWVISRVKRVKYIYCVTDLWPDLMVASGVVKSRILVRLLTVLEHFAYKSADIVAPNSYGMVDRLQQKGVLLEKIRVLPDWADEELFRPVPPDLGFSQQYGFDTHFTIMFAGQLGVAQDLDTFIDALKLLESNLDVWGVIVGDGLEKDRLMAKVRELGLANVCFTGRVPQESMPSIYATADVMLVQLGSARGFSMSVPQKVYGYMGAGRPILGAVSGATADLINRADCGLVCLPGDAGAMATCITEFAQISKLRREQMGENGRQQFLLEYSRSVTLSKYELTLKELM
jgi:glycosyltransferase involved in cell wall biosynthesis